MATIHVRNVPEEVVAALKARAAEQGRSLNAEVVSVLVEAAPRRRPVEEVLAEIRRHVSELGPEARSVDVVELIREDREERGRRIVGDV